MKDYYYTIVTPDVEFPETFTVRCSDPMTAMEWASAVFYNRVRWWLITHSDTVTILNDLRKMDHFTVSPLTVFPQTGICDENDIVLWPDGERKDCFSCMAGEFYLESGKSVE